MTRLNEKKGFFTLLGLLIALAIICVLSYTLLNTYFKPGLAGESANQSLSSQGIDTSSYRSVKDSTREKIEEITQQRTQQMDDFMKQVE